MLIKHTDYSLHKVSKIFKWLLFCFRYKQPAKEVGFHIFSRTFSYIGYFVLSSKTILGSWLETVLNGMINIDIVNRQIINLNQHMKYNLKQIALLL